MSSLQGCASWKWYFPYHYAPFASDFVNIGELPNDFEKNTRPVSLSSHSYVLSVWYAVIGIFGCVVYLGVCRAGIVSNCVCTCVSGKNMCALLLLEWGAVQSWMCKEWCVCVICIMCVCVHACIHLHACTCAYMRVSLLTQACIEFVCLVIVPPF